MVKVTRFRRLRNKLNQANCAGAGWAFPTRIPMIL